MSLDAEFQGSMGFIPVEGNIISIGGWIVWPNLIHHKVRKSTKHWDLTKAYQHTEIPRRTRSTILIWANSKIRALIM